jgi:hypothetical protein
MKRFVTLLHLVCSFTILVATMVSFPAVSKSQEGREPTLQLVVELNGQEIKGLEYIREQWSKTPRGKRLETANNLMEANTVHLRQGTTNKLTVLLVLPNGDRKDITRDPGLEVWSYSKGLLASRDALTVTPQDKKDNTNIPWHASFSVAYAPQGKDGPFGFDKFSLLLTE